MKQFILDRHTDPLNPTLEEVPNEVIKIYDDKAAADLDLANIEENEIIATKAGESEGVVEVVDIVEEDNPNAVSSGAVYDYTAENISTAMEWQYKNRFTSTGTYQIPDWDKVHEILLVETNQGSTAYGMLTFPAINIKNSPHINYWITAGGISSAGNISETGLVTVSTLSSRYLYVFVR